MMGVNEFGVAACLTYAGSLYLGVLLERFVLGPARRKRRNRGDR